MIQVKDLIKDYDGLRALDRISFNVKQGEIFGLLGPNGAGKTTTVKILSGMLPKTSGEVLIGGYNIDTHPLEVKRRIGLVPEDSAVYDNLTAREFVFLVGRLHLLDDSIILERMEALRDFLELDEEEMSKRLSEFSKGMRQKILIICALLHDPSVLFLDEPLQGLDANSSLKVRSLFRHLADRGKTILFCSHILDVVEKTCDRIAILHQGRIKVIGTVEEIINATGEPSLEMAFHKLTTSEDIEDAVKELLKGFGDEEKK